MPRESKDVSTIGASEEHKNLMKRLVDEGLFIEEGDVARFAFAVAIRKELDPISGPKTTAWQVNQFDQNQTIHGFVVAYSDDDQGVYRRVQDWIAAGLTHIEQELESRQPEAVLGLDDQ